MNVRGIIFDKDGTLTDLQARWSPVFCGMIEHLADGDASVARRLADVLDVDLDRRIVIPHGVAAVGNVREVGGPIREVLLAAGVAPDDLGERMRDAFRRAPDGPLVPLGDVTATMAALAADGCRLGIATADGRGNTMRELAVLEIDRYVDEVRCGDDDGAVKPDPEVLWSICRAWSLDPQDVTYVGDSWADLRCARAAEVRFVAVGDLGAPPPDLPDGAPDAVVADIGELR